MTSAPSRRTCAALAIAAYLLVALLAFHNVLGSPSTRLVNPAVVHERANSLHLDRWDQAMVIATVVRNAHQLTSRPWELFADVGQCYPMPAAYTLGEHMFGVGLLAALPYALTADPILSFNVALILTLWIPAITMYFLSLRFTRSPAAAFVAGLAFMLVPGRLIDPSHPYVHGDLWAPAVLLFTHRLFVSAKWRDALGLALFLNLEVFESLYPLISTGLMAGTYGLYLLYRHRQNLARVAPPLLFALGLTALGAWLVLGPYLETSAQWGLLGGRLTVLLRPQDFSWGGDYFPGFAVLALVLLGLLDRLRGPRPVHGEDPRWAFLAGGLLIFWSSLHAIRIPALGLVIESPFLALREIVPGIAAVRALAAIALSVGIATSFLAGYAVLALGERLGSSRRGPPLVAAVCALALLSLRFVPSFAEASFGRSLQLIAFEARPSQDDIDLLRRTGRGPLVDYPLGRQDDRHKRLDIAKALFLASYDPRPQAACYNSFHAPVNDQMIMLAAKLPSPAAIDALATLGFETVFVDRARAGPVRLRRFDPEAGNETRGGTGLTHLGSTAAFDAYRIRSSAAVRSDFAALGAAASGEATETTSAVMPDAEIEFSIANEGPETFRHPDPLQPSELVVRWQDETGWVVFEQAQRALLPIALGAGDDLPLTLELTTPAVPGDYLVTVARAADPSQILARRRVDLPPLEDLMSPSQIAVHLHREFIENEVARFGNEIVFPPSAEVTMLLSPDLTSAMEFTAHGKVAAHWFNSFDDGPTLLFDANAKPTGVAGRIRVRLPVPVQLGLHYVVVTPADDPRTLLAATMLTPDAKTVKKALAEAQAGSP